MKRKDWFIFCIMIVALVGVILTISLGRASFQRHIKGTITDFNGGAQRTATIYSNDGKVLAIYEGKIDIADDNNYETQLLVDGQVVNIIGGITIIEEK